MRIAFYGNFTKERKTQLRGMAILRGHTVVYTPQKAAVVFTMAYAKNLAQMDEIRKRGGFVVVLATIILKEEVIGAYFKAGAYDVTDCPCTDDGVDAMLAMLESEMKEIFS